MARSGRIGKIFNVEANFTQVLGDDLANQVRIAGGSILSLASYPLLAIFKLLGFNYNRVDFISHKVDDVDILSKINSFMMMRWLLLQWLLMLKLRVI